MDIVLAGTLEYVCRHKGVHMLTLKQTLQLRTTSLSQFMGIALIGDNIPTPRDRSIYVKCEAISKPNCLVAHSWSACEPDTNINFVYTYGRMMADLRINGIDLAADKPRPTHLFGKNVHAFGHLFFPDYVSPKLVLEHVIDADQTGIHSVVGAG